MFLLISEAKILHPGHRYIPGNCKANELARLSTTSQLDSDDEWTEITDLVILVRFYLL